MFVNEQHELLYHTLHYSVRHVCHSLTPKQIDKGVIDASRKHLRTVCGDSLDNLRGKNYEVSDNFYGYRHSLYDPNL